MRIRTALSEDTTSAALNTKAHAPEHCAIDRTSLDVLGSAVARQVLIRTSAQHLALYTVAEHIDAAGRAAHVGTAGLARLEDPTGEPPATLGATVETQFTGGDSQAPVRLTEQLLGKGATGLAVLAPHGGKIEVGTDDQATSVFKALAQNGKPVRAWIARGFNPKARIGAGTSPRRRSRSSRSPGWARSSVPARPAELSLTPSRSTARTTARQSSSAAGFPGTRRTTRSR